MVTVQALDFAKGIAFSKSDPLTGYACGNVGIDVPRTPSDVLKISVTHDGGRTWSAPVATTVSWRRLQLLHQSRQCH